MFLNNCLKVVGAAVTYFYGVFIEDFVVAVFLWEMLADQVQKFSSDVCLHVHAVGWIFQKVLAEIVQKDLILSQKALISNRRNLGLFAPTSMRFPSKDSKSKDLSF